MTVNYDPDGIPELTAGMLEQAAELDLQILNVICDEPGARYGDNTGVSFAVLSQNLPRQGDRLILEDGKTCEVKRVYFKTVRFQQEPHLVATVYAILVEREE